MAQAHIREITPDDHLRGEPRGSSPISAAEFGLLRRFGRPDRHLALLALVVLAFSGFLVISVFVGPARALTVSTLAGGLPSVDGTGNAARFLNPFGICYDSADGNLYVADTMSATIRRVTPAGVVTTLAGSSGSYGSTDGKGSSALFSNPSGICYESVTGNLYVTDNCTIRQVTPEGVVTTVAGSSGQQGSADGTGGAARFNNPWGICYNSADGNLYVTDGMDNTIRRVTRAGVVTTLAGSPGSYGSADGTGSVARFYVPRGICYDAADGNLYVTDGGNAIVRRVTPAGVVTTLAGSPLLGGIIDGTGSAARFGSLQDICFNSADGNLYVTDGVGTLRRVTPAGVVTTLAGSANIRGSTDGTGSAARFGNLAGVCYNSVTGNLYVTDGPGTIRQVTPAGLVITLAGSANNWDSADGTGSAARFLNPFGICYNPVTGDLYVTDGRNQTIRQVTPAGVVTTIAGSPGQLGSADGIGNAARFFGPRGICYASTDGNLYVADTGNHTIRRVTAAGVVTTLAGGPGRNGSSDGMGSAALFSYPSAICYNSADGNLYVADAGNHTIRRVTPAGVVTTLAGGPGQQGSKDGTGSAARFAAPAGICFDSTDGNLYVTDTNNHTIRRVTPAGVVTTLAGGPGQQGSKDGTGSAARFGFPGGICFNSAGGNLYVADGANATIRQVTPDGLVTTLAGSPGKQGRADGAGYAARFTAPTGVCFDSSDGNLYVADTGNNIIRVVSLTQTLGFSDIASSPFQVAILDLVSRKVISGFLDGTFRPGSPVTRQQFAKMIVKSLALPVALSDICPFADVGSGTDPTDPLYPDHYVAVCFADGITQGTSATTFAPYADITRAQVITMIVRAADALGIGSLISPPAIWQGTLPSSDATHGGNIRKAEYNGLLYGVPLSGWNIWGNASRGEVAQMLSNLRNRPGATGPSLLTPDEMKRLSAWSSPEYLSVRSSRIFGEWAAAVIDNDTPPPSEGSPPMGCICVFKWEPSGWTVFDESSFIGETDLFPRLRSEGAPEGVVQWLETQMGF